MARVQDVPGGDFQGIVLGACHRTAGPHLVAAGGPAPPAVPDWTSRTCTCRTGPVSR